MEKQVSVCEVCGEEASSEKQKRHGNWIMINGGCTAGIYVWLEKPRKNEKGASGSYMHHVGWKERVYDFCSVKCLVRALTQKESI